MINIYHIKKVSHRCYRYQIYLQFSLGISFAEICEIRFEVHVKHYTDKRKSCPFAHVRHHLYYIIFISGNISVHILNLDTRWMWAVTLALRKSSQYLMDKGLSGPHSQHGLCGIETFLLLLRTKPRFQVCSACSLVSYPILSWSEIKWNSFYNVWYRSPPVLNLINFQW